MGLGLSRKCPPKSEPPQLPRPVLQVTASAQPRKYTLESFQICRTIGTGSYSVVRLAVDKLTQEPVVLKIMKKSHVIVKGQIDHIENEREILSHARSPFIVKLKGTLQTPHFLLYVLEFVPGGEMFRYLSYRMTLFESEVQFFGSEITVGLKYLHSIGCVYRDLKPENVLISAAGHVKLTDLGFAKRLKSEEKTKTLCGTPEYLAPEVIERVGHGKEVDWWQMGILLYEMLFGATPFSDSSPYQLYENILSKPISIPDCVPRVKSLLTGLLQKKPENRFKEDEILKHEFFAGIDWDVVERLGLNPTFVPVVKGPIDTRNFDDYLDKLEPEKAVLIDVFPYF